MEQAAPESHAPGQLTHAQPTHSQPTSERSPAERLVVADSFRVRVHNGVTEVRGFERHLTRFGTAVSLVTGGSLLGVGNFVEASRERIAAYGAGFPRLELWELGTAGEHERATFELRLSLRPLPELRDTIELRTASGIALERPSVKGANLRLLGELNEQLAAEALLVDAAGQVVEGATAALLWWDRDVLCSVSNRERVPSVAEALLLEAAHTQGFETSARTITPAALATHEVWAVNALHGLRPVTLVDAQPTGRGTSERLHRFQAALDATWAPVRTSQA